MNATKSKFATCRHIKTNGRVCQSPALTGGALCYFHRNLHHTHRRPADAVHLASEWQEDEIQFGDGTNEDYVIASRVYPHQDEIQFPPLEDAESVQLATSMLFQAIATGQIAFRRARMLVATLKIACINQRALANSRAAESNLQPIPTSIVRNTHGDILAAPEEAAAAEPAIQPSPEPAETVAAQTVSAPETVPASETVSINQAVPASESAAAPVSAAQTFPAPETVPASEAVPASEIGRDFSPGIHPTASTGALEDAEKRTHLLFGLAWGFNPTNKANLISMGFSPGHYLEAPQPPFSAPSLAPGTCLPPTSPEPNPPDISILDTTPLERGFCRRTRQLSH